MTELQELMALYGLIAEFRRWQRISAETKTEREQGKAAAFRACADELETLLRSPSFAEMTRDAERYRFLRDMKCCTFSLSRDEGHAINYETLESFAEASPEWYADVPEDELQKMRDTNTDWALQIYPDTPIGFYVWHAATLDTAIDAAIDAAASGGG